ncbi:hypothetical protein OSCT_0289 [Oscillochloris trichoides DG-6]|uniref:Uncharacterized protein n=1 Tax=Oscillochloris trichoides DG-6 TaxID=765420 RepID=E1IAD8_9CHLR|nr:hypothetical protein OSCT_0289 [Oscillochloris trichoides DG-6]
MGDVSIRRADLRLSEHQQGAPKCHGGVGFNPPGGFEAFGTSMVCMDTLGTRKVSIRRADLRLSERLWCCATFGWRSEVSIRRADLRLSELRLHHGLGENLGFQSAGRI